MKREDIKSIPYSREEQKLYCVDFSTKTVDLRWSNLNKADSSAGVPGLNSMVVIY